MPKKRVFAVLGAGSGGQAIAGCLAAGDARVRLWNRSPDKLESIVENSHLKIEGSFERVVHLDAVTTELPDAVEGAHVIMIVMPATAHRPMARKLAPILKRGQVVVLNPGRTGGALEFRHALQQHGCEEGVLVAEAQTLLVASRLTGPGVCRIFSIKRSVGLAAVPAVDTPNVVAALANHLPQFYAESNVLQTSLDNMGAIFHPGVTVLNMSRIEATNGDFDYYHDGVTPTVARVITQIDRERRAVARAYGVQARSARTWLYDAYGAEGRTLHEAVLNNTGYSGIKAPADLDHRYIWEDVPASLVPISELGRLAGVATPTIDGIVAISSAAHGVDYRSIGRNAHNMGLTGLSPQDVLELAYKGVVAVDEPRVAESPVAGGLSG